MKGTHEDIHRHYQEFLKFYDTPRGLKKYKTEWTHISRVLKLFFCWKSTKKRDFLKLILFVIVWIWPVVLMTAIWEHYSKTHSQKLIEAFWVRHHITSFTDLWNRVSVFRKPTGYLLQQKRLYTSSLPSRFSSFEKNIIHAI